MQVSGLLHDPAALLLGEKVPGTRCIGGWVGPSQCQHCGEERNLLPNHPARRYTN
jgi:hypothetical protein